MKNMSGLFKVKQDHFKYVKILCWHVWLTLNGEGKENHLQDLLYMMGQVSKKSREEYLKREATEDKFYLFILWRAKLDRILFLVVFYHFLKNSKTVFTLIQVKHRHLINLGI